MSTAIQITGEIIAGPLGAQDNAFPSGVTSMPIQVPQFAAAAEFHASKQVAATSFVTLDGVGTAGIVTQATLLYFKCQSPMQVRITQKADTGPDVVAIEYVQGVLLKQAPASNYISLVEVLGAGVVEYLVAGNL